MNETAIIICPNCNNKLRVPNDKGAIMFTCPVCRSKWPYQGTAKVNASTTLPPNKPSVSSGVNNNVKKPTPSMSSVSNNTVKKPTPPPQPVYKPQSPTRTVTIQRLMHAYKDLTFAGLKNMYVDSMNVQIYLDGEKQGLLNKDRLMVLNIDSCEHTISTSPISSKYRIPKGDDSYSAAYFNGGFMIGSVDDKFRDELTQFVLNMVRGQGFRDRILDPNNRHHAVKVTIQSNYIRVHWSLSVTKGFAEWSSGEKEEKIYYNQIGLTPTPDHLQPSGYWDYLNSYIRDAVVNDPKADLEYGLGGFTFRKTHGLY